MSINADKTKTMLLSTKPKIKAIKDRIPEINLNDTKLQHTSCVKLLGVHIDECLSWKSQIDTIIKKCNSLLYLLCRIKKYLSIPSRKLFFNAYVLPHLDYCATVWGSLQC